MNVNGEYNEIAISSPEGGESLRLPVAVHAVYAFCAPAELQCHENIGKGRLPG
jgi:hypothetical protein